jgi:hypothetical protein
VYETTKGSSQKGVAARQSAGPLQFALSPSAQDEKCAQQPGAPQPQVPGSMNTEWQSVRASQSESVVTLEHGATHLIAGHDGGGSTGREQPANTFA